MSNETLRTANEKQTEGLWSAPGFVPTLVAVAAAFGAWSILLPVVPTAVIESGGSSTLAGGSTGIFMLATVITQLFTPAMLRKVGYNPVMAVSAFLLGVPALGHMLGSDAWVVLLFSALRGVGFGAITVSQSALVAELVPVRYLGKATGMLGVFIGLSQMFLLPVGLIVAGRVNYDVVYIAAAVIAVVAALMCLRIPRLKPAPVTPSTASTTTEAEVAPAPTASTWKLVLVPSLALTTITMSFGAVSTFLPVAVREVDPVTGAAIGGFMLSIVGGSSMVCRYVAGVVADRQGRPGSLMIASQLSALAGVALMAATIAFGWTVWLLVVAALFFGAGFGAAQNEALLSLFYRLPRSRVSDASAIWNVFYDAGTGLGSVVFGAAVAAWFYSGAFAAGAVVIILGIGMTLLDAFIGRHRVSEHDNIKLRLRLVKIKAGKRIPRPTLPRPGSTRVPAARRRTVLHERSFDDLAAPQSEGESPAGKSTREQGER